MKACRPGNAARILAKIGGEQTGWVIGGELMQINGGDKVPKARTPPAVRLGSGSDQAGGPWPGFGRCFNYIHRSISLKQALDGIRTTSIHDGSNLNQLLRYASEDQ